VAYLSFGLNNLLFLSPQFEGERAGHLARDDIASTQQGFISDLCYTPLPLPLHSTYFLLPDIWKVLLYLYLQVRTSCHPQAPLVPQITNGSEDTGVE